MWLFSSLFHVLLPVCKSTESTAEKYLNRALFFKYGPDIGMQFPRKCVPKARTEGKLNDRTMQ